MTPYSLYVSSREGDIYTLYREITESSNRMGFHPSATYTNFHFFTPKSVLITTFNKTDEVYFSSYYPPLVICVAGPQYHCAVVCYIISGEETHTSLLITVFCHCMYCCTFIIIIGYVPFHLFGRQTFGVIVHLIERSPYGVPLLLTLSKHHIAIVLC